MVGVAAGAGAGAAAAAAATVVSHHASSHLVTITMV